MEIVSAECGEAAIKIMGHGGHHEQPGTDEPLTSGERPTLSYGFCSCRISVDSCRLIRERGSFKVTTSAGSSSRTISGKRARTIRRSQSSSSTTS